MALRKLHIICTSVPHPPDYGGAIDVFYKIKALHEIGVDIILHCFEYTRPQSEELKKYCNEVHYYPRKSKILSQFSMIPYIVKSRFNPFLLQRLMKDNYPILFEGIHTTAYLNHPALSGRKKWLRAHNIENDYYNSLFKAERKLYKKCYYKLESLRIKKYNAIHSSADGVFAISQFDAAYLNNFNENTVLLNAFHGHSRITSQIGKGDYILYHGDLSVAENNRSAEFMVEVCKSLPYRLRIAGKNPQSNLVNLVKHHKNIDLIDNPDEIDMEDYIQNAGVILLPAKQKTGLRLKLLVSLFKGRHCIASPEMVIDTGLEKLCQIADNKEEWRQTIKLCMDTPFTEYHYKQRIQPLKIYTDTDNAREIVKLIFEEKRVI